MTAFTLAVSLVNVTVVVWRTSVAAADRRLSAVWWLLLSYFSLLMLIDTVKGEFNHTLEWTGRDVFIPITDFVMTNLFVLLSNGALAVGDIVSRRLFANWRKSIRNDRAGNRYEVLLVLYTVVLGIAALGYGVRMRGYDYTTYVEANESNWWQVAFIASAPSVLLAILRRRWILAAIGVSAYTYFAVVLEVRSFLLLSACPAIVWLWIAHGAEHPRFRGRSYWPYVAIVAALVMGVSIYRGTVRGAESLLPERQLPTLMRVAFSQMLNSPLLTGWDSLERYSYGVARPFFRLLGVPPPVTVDPPVLAAQLVTGYPVSGARYFHYPLLWYTDSFMAFGWLGAGLGLLWGLVFGASEHLARRDPLSCALLLPYVIWHGYMILRGAPAIATVPISFAVYMQLLVLAAYSMVRLRTYSKSPLRNNSGA